MNMPAISMTRAAAEEALRCCKFTVSERDDLLNALEALGIVEFDPGPISWKDRQSLIRKLLVGYTSDAMSADLTLKRILSLFPDVKTPD